MTPRDGYKPDEPQRTSIDALAEARHIANIIAGGDEAAKREIADAIGTFIYNQLNARVYNDVRDDRRIRVTADGADVTDDASGNQIKYPAESYFDHINVEAPLTANVQSSIRGRQINIKGGGGALDCIADYIVSSCWATTVAAGLGTEGQVFSSLAAPTCTFRVYSTVQAAVTHADAQNAARTIFVCGGTYAETVTISVGHQLRIIGAGRERTLITSAGGSTDAFIMDQVLAGGNDVVEIQDLTLNGSRYGVAYGTAAAQGGDTTIFTRCNIRGTTKGIFVTQTAANQYFYDCDVQNVLLAGTASGETNSAVQNWYMLGGTLGGWDHEATSNHTTSNNVQLRCRTYTGALNFFPMNDLYWEGKFVLTQPTRQITFTKGTNQSKEFRRVVLTGEFVAPHGASVAAYDVLVNSDCFIRGGESRCRHPYPSSVSNTVNRWKVPGGLESFGIFDNFEVDGSHLALIENTTYIDIDASGGGIIRQSDVFCTGGRYNVNFGTGTKNTINGVQIDSGAPSHEAPEGMQYWDSTANTMYVNTDGSTTWSVVGVSGGGAAAPVGADYLVGTANATLTNEIVVGTTPGGELGGTWASPTVDSVHSGSAHHAEAHGISAHTAHGNWKALYTDGSGDEQELSLGAANTIYRSAGTSSAPTMSAMYVTHILVFSPTAEDLASGSLAPIPGICVGESGEHGTFSLIRAKAIAGTAGSGTNTIIIEADDNPGFSSATTIYTLALNTSTEVDDTTQDNSWNTSDIFIRARCTAVDASPPSDVVVTVYLKQQVENY